MAKLNPGLGNKYAKEAMLKELGRGGTSGAVVKATDAAAGSAGGAAFKSAQFFSKLQVRVCLPRLATPLCTCRCRCVGLRARVWASV